MTDAEKLAKWQEIGRALMEEYDLRGHVYDVREDVRNADDFTEWLDANPTLAAWDHPKVKRFVKLVQQMEELLER